MRYDLPEVVNVKLIIYNILGQEVTRLVDATQGPGRYSVTWNGKNQAGASLSSGLYMYRIISGDFVQTRKMVLLK
ncbi:MAG: T9SS type A sorting domain-containing protein [Candidatus Marinimicrobia bacterium]|nr:T9SS type A sorting domain-containing protein [Candidatus Neomarinimicrobiota bacterium]